VPPPTSTLDPARGAAGVRTLPDLLWPGLDLVFVGINPGERSAQLGHYYGHRGNGFWRVLSDSGLAGGDVGPNDDRTLPGRCGIGFTDVVKRVVTDSTRVTDAELRASAHAFERRIAYASPRAVCFTTTRAFDVLFPRVRASRTWGRQPVRIADAEVWVMPSTSGRAAGYREEGQRVLAAIACALGRGEPR
jgi:TDG/mug DNA glycosylase family protein